MPEQPVHPQQDPESHQQIKYEKEIMMMKTIDNAVLEGYDAGIERGRLREELALGGFETASVHGVMGGAWLAPNIDSLLAHGDTREMLMKTVRMLDTHEEIIGLSGHLLAVSAKKG